MDIYPGKDDRLVYEAVSAMQHIKVFDKLNGLRYLLLNGVQHGGHLPGMPKRLVMPYFRLGFVSLAFLEHPKDFLFVGLGMGGMPAFLRVVKPDARIDVVEIDPAVIETAKVWFGFTEDERLKVSAGDGREYIKNASRKYDVVFLDAYRDLSVPGHLTTLEFMREVRAVLNPGGVVVSNLWGSVVNPLFGACVKTLQEAFPELYQFRSYTYNYIFVADTKEGQSGPGELLTRARKVTASTDLGFDLVDMVRRNFSRVTDDYFHGEPIRDP